MHRSMGLHNKTNGKGRSVASRQLSGKAAAGFGRGDFEERHGWHV